MIGPYQCITAEQQAGHGREARHACDATSARGLIVDALQESADAERMIASRRLYGVRVRKTHQYMEV